MHGHKLVLTKIALNFVSPVVSPREVKTGGFLITCDKAMRVLALATTFAGNLTIIGSVANMIVVESAREHLEVSFWDYTRFGIPITMLTTAAGVVLLLLLHRKLQPSAAANLIFAKRSKFFVSPVVSPGGIRMGIADYMG